MVALIGSLLFGQIFFPDRGDTIKCVRFDEAKFSNVAVFRIAIVLFLKGFEPSSVLIRVF